jgi:glycosyltransferase involved in cell wall biosynthesis
VKIALVHDYLKEYGGAERVLMTLHELYPEAPIYTAFCHKNSFAGKAFANAEIKESWLAPLIKHGQLYSPLRFLTPLIWKSFNFTNYDLVITSASWYITRGFRVGPKTKIICYCHTPPRYLYGYPTSIEWQRYWPVRLYGMIINHFLRLYDYRSAQQVNEFVVNSKNVAARVKKFYRRSSTVIYPPVEVGRIIEATRNLKPQNYYLIVSRIVGAKGIELAATAARKAKVNLKVVGEPAGLRWFGGKLETLKGKGVEFLGRVPDTELYRYYGQCRAFLALARDEDFGVAPVEAMAAGRPVIAFRGGGYLESVVEGKTGEFFEQLEANNLAKILKSFKPDKYKPADCRQQAKKFSKERFKKEMRAFIQKHA